jgi:hypothetical protein
VYVHKSHREQNKQGTRSYCQARKMTNASNGFHDGCFEKMLFEAFFVAFSLRKMLSKAFSVVFFLNPNSARYFQVDAG